MRDKAPVLALVHGALRPSFETWRALAGASGFRDARELASAPSRFLGRIYCAVSIRA